MEEEDKIESISVKRILNKNFPAESYLIDNLIHTETLTVISGQPASFKTWVCIHLGIALTEGGSFLGHFKIPSKQRVLIFDRENHEKHLQIRLKALKASENTDMWYSFDHDFRLDNDKDISSLIKQVNKNGKTKLIVFDSLIRFHRGDENDARHMSLVLNNLKKIISQTGASVIFTHHHRKESAYGTTSSNSLRGSSDIFAAVDCHISLSHQKKDNLIVFSHLKSRQSIALEPFSAKIITDEKNKTLEIKYVGEYDRQQEKKDEASNILKEFFKETKGKTVTFKEIDEILEGAFSRNIINSVLENFINDGYITKTIGRANKSLYNLTENIEDS